MQPPLSFEFEFWAERDAAALALQRRIVRAEERAKGHPEYQVVCRYWLDGICSAGDRCYFLHSYNLDKIPVCAFMETQRCPEGAMCKFRHYYHAHELRGKSRQDPQRSEGVPSTVHKLKM